ncbi:Inorganic triphosphatase YgiF, contains CYTH and CHAD domains [Mesorhizobium albiziae]|uniref:Inorganic triphosphatase YgiF, contains CYTH and CHAD domains n=1 Tax=Neomesorhizobium albiziae TaxID=335020 RepID=A0A1I4CHK2_9HYPH|nr:CYTH and CHAD domain-containing protein [Mesorhizobium albiziae]GLS29264.1 inorganic triphosphatase [Mesorhizobium albiziae]SFK80722.1 Inorganic triphosphatase YgiF, contains CYTH and CHAD domains [Mesorhizobium albiziae]
MSEIELKFILDEPTSSEFWARVKASKLANGRPRTKTLRSIYLDTPEHALKKAGIALRLRRDGRRWIQTVKTGAELHGGLSQVGEVENFAPGGRLCLEAIPDASVRDEVLQCVNGAPLQPVCETMIKRSTTELALEDGTRAELAADVGEVRAGKRSAELREVEIELIEGNPGGLFDIAHVLFPDGGLRFSRLSKAARGYLLADEGRIDTPLAPRNAQVVVLDPTQIAEHAARDMLRECLDQIATNVVVVRKLDDPEGPHQLRIGLRRLRSVFSVYAPVLKSPEMARLKDEARWLGQEVGSLRDLDVVANDIVQREAKIHQDETGLTALSYALSRQAKEVRERLRELLAQTRVQAFLIDLARFVETRGWLVPQDFGQTARLATPVAELAGQALSKLWKRVGKRAGGLETLDTEQRHELRKELKKLRYAVEFFAPLYPSKRVDPFLKRLKKLQTVFGDLNDAATVRAMLSGTDAPGTGDPVAQRAIGWVIGASQARAEFGWTGAKTLWRNLEETRPFWK